MYINILLPYNYSSLLKRLHVSGKLDNTLLILMADHGNRYTQFRQTIQGSESQFIYLN